MGRIALAVGFIEIAGLLGSAPAHAADFGSAGPLQVTTASLAANEGGATGGYVVVPNGPGPYPLILASHGWSASADQQVGWGQQFASWGFVVVAPSFPNTLTPNDQTDAQIIEALVALYADPAHSSPAQGKVDGSRVGLEGHSAGGLATTIAAAALHPQATVLFDPVDSNGDGQKALPGICGALLGVFANPSSCNDQEGWWPYANTAAGPEVLFHVVGSTHCDGENQPRALCGGVCGGAADPGRQVVYARYATAFFLAHLAADATAAAALTLGALAADSAVTSATVKNAPECAGTGDGGDAGTGTTPGGGDDDASPPTPGGGVPPGPGLDGGAGAQGGADAGTSAPGEMSTAAGGDPSSGGCACASAGAPPRRSTGALAVLALGLAIGGRRRAR